MTLTRPLLGALLGLVCVVETHPKVATAAEEEGVIEPQADAVLHRMSDYLVGLKAFRLETTLVDEKITTDRQKIQELKESKITVKRPGELRVDRVGPMGHAVFRYDGAQFSLYNADKNAYAQSPAPPTLDAALDFARDRLHVDAPAGDLIATDVYKALTDDLKEGRYVGLEPIGNVKAHHLAMTKKDVDYQLWIQDGPQPVPLRYVIVSKDMPGEPEFTLEMRNWETNPTTSDDEFKFTIPKNAKRIELAPTQPETKKP
jgi:hypothetical protein